jgi:hypothetical protein
LASTTACTRESASRAMRLDASLLPGHRLEAGDFGSAFIAVGCRTFRDAAALVRSLPYGRTTSRGDTRLALLERRGTCSTKHALLAPLAREQRIAVQLVVGIYHMAEADTHGIGHILASRRLVSIPEAHCWLRYVGHDIDLTFARHQAGKSERHFFCEKYITPECVSTYSPLLHRREMQRWLNHLGRTDLTLDDAWAVWEACIAALQEPPDIEGPG